MRQLRLRHLLALAGPLALLGGAVAAQPHDAVETPYGPAWVEGEAFTEGGLRLLVGGRELLRSEEDLHLWVEAVEGDWLLVGFGSGGTACPAMWRWVNAGTGAASEPFGTCADTAEVVAAKDGRMTVAMPSWDPDHPTSDFVWDGTAVTEIPRGQAPAAVPPGAPGDAWLGRYPYEMFVASDWRGPLVDLLGAETYAEAQAAFGISTPMEAQGDWVVGTGCVPHACDMLRGAVAVHRGDGRVVVALASQGPYGGQSWVWGETDEEELPPAVADLLRGEAP